MVSGKLGALTAALLLGAGAARADVSISSKPTSNMTCDSGVCTATAAKAVLNVGDLQTMLAGGDVAVKTGTLAKDIDIAAPLTWSNTSRLTLDAQQSVTIKKPVTVAGTGALTISTNDTGQPKNKSKNGEFVIMPERGSVQFWDTASSLVIDGNSYTLVNDIKTLASDIAANPSGFYALAKPYDATADGTYTASPVPTRFSGVFEGLGNTISNLHMVFSYSGDPNGFFANVQAGGTVRHIGLANVQIGGVSDLGALVADNSGSITRDWATGTIDQTRSESLGGLVGGSVGVVSESFAKMRIQVSDEGHKAGGGLVGINRGTISKSYAAGTILYRKSSDMDVGGLVGLNEGLIENSFAINSVRVGKQVYDSEAGGLVGVNDDNGRIVSSYGAGLIKDNSGVGSGTEIGGLVGSDQTTGQIESAYWDLDKGVTDPSRGAGNIKNDAGITGLTDAQLQSGLPAGFDPKVWNQDSHRNQGYPFLVSVPAK